MERSLHRPASFDHDHGDGGDDPLPTNSEDGYRNGVCHADSATAEFYTLEKTATRQAEGIKLRHITPVCLCVSADVANFFHSVA